MGNNKYKVLIVEDDQSILGFVQTILETNGYQVLTAERCRQGLLIFSSYTPDLVVLDLGLPDMDGGEFIRQVRLFSTVPIIVLSARTEENDKVSALDAGADDYLTKPFSVEELLARLRVALRRVRYDTQKTDQEASVYQNGALKIDYAGGCAYRGEQEIHLTPIEYKLLCLLAKNTGKVLTHNYILSQVWGNSTASDTPSLRVFMATLRKKLETDPSHPQYIQTHIGVGYRMLRQKETPDAS